MAKPYYEFFCPVKVIAGNAALEHIPFELATLGAKRPMIITDKGVRANGLLGPIEAAFSTTDAVIGAIFDDVPPDSSLEVVRQAAELYRKQNCDAIIAIGGGSVIDTSKATNILVSEGGNDLLQYSGAHNLPKPLKPFFVIPTTSGTGSEATMVAVVSDTQRNVKLAFASYYLMPHAAILDPRMTQTLPPHLTAMTGMDALTHCVEAYTCLAANPLSDAYASAGISPSENPATASALIPASLSALANARSVRKSAGCVFSVLVSSSPSPSKHTLTVPGRSDSPKSYNFFASESESYRSLPIPTY